ncbi:NADAR family protein [Streptomyces sp. NPDC050418]|uniref:NADAR family protein n=1 Tax=Streptomyces sp. NPDC050418 TaxID=3365612 RepID=UPI0037ACFBF5
MAIEATESKIDALAERVKNGENVKFLHFWGHTAPADGAVGPHVLSQWWPALFTVDEVGYATAEHWMMAAKARLFGDEEAERAAVTASSPGAAKKAGRLVRGFDEEIWRRERFEVVAEGSTHKFAAHPQLRAYLLGTGDRVLVEASPLDRIWGIGLAAADERAADPGQWRGLNLLGFALMEARERLRAGV